MSGLPPCLGFVCAKCCGRVGANGFLVHSAGVVEAADMAFGVIAVCDAECLAQLRPLVEMELESISIGQAMAQLVISSGTAPVLPDELARASRHYSPLRPDS